MFVDGLNDELKGCVEALGLTNMDEAVLQLNLISQLKKRQGASLF